MRTLVALLLLFPLSAMAQEINFTEGAYTGCGVFVVDSGGNAGPYGANENLTFTVCPEAPETIVNLTWIIFNLASDADMMTIYDGNGTGGALIGEYTLMDLQGQTTVSSGADGGCLTLVFTSVGEGGNFAFGVACGEPCYNPFVVVETGLAESPGLICPEEEITFDASETIVGENAVLEEYFWEFGDGETATTTEPTVTHSYTNPGAYRVDLTVTDSNGCQNVNLADVILLVSTDPDFTGTTTDLEICLGQEVDLNGVVQGVQWDATPDANFGGALFIPDVQTECFETELTFSSFLPGQVIESPADFESLFINFEHSYMGDLVMTLYCPNGQSLILHQQGGGGTYLGIPVDVDAQPNDPGTGFDYFWAPDATNGTWEAESGGVATLPSGTYSTVGSWENLNGCPLNGSWSLEICDIFGSDNGFIFDWAIFFDESLYPDLITFTPTFGAECDSTSWSGPSITGQSPDCNTITVQPDALGVETYTFTGVNNHGCSYSTDVNVTVTQGPIAAGPTVVYVCDGQAQLNAEVTNPEAGVQYTYAWTPGDFLSNANVANPQINGLEDPSTYSVFVAPVGAPECGSSWDVDVEIPLPPVPLEYDELDACAGSTFGIPSPNQPDGWDYVYEWVYLSAVDPDAVIGTGNNLQATESGNYQLTVTMEAPCFYTAVGDVDIVFNACELGPIPNVFTPNGDQINDRFLIEGLQFFSGTKLRVYNRWGGLVFESDNYQNNWSPSASDLAEGTYYYIMEVDFRDQRGVETFSGTVNIFRN